MTIIYASGYSLPGSDEPLTHARLLHASAWDATGIITADTTDAAYFEDAPNNSLTYELWKPTAIPATWKMDYNPATPSFDTCCVAAHTLGTTGSTVAIQSYNGATWDTRISATLILTNEPIMFIFVPAAAERWRLKITASTSGIPTIGVIRFGNMLQFPRPILGSHTPINYGRKTILNSNLSETAEFLGRSIARTQLATAYSWSNLDYTWITANWESAQRAMELEPFFLAWRPTKTGVVAYGMVDETPEPTFQGVRDLMSLQFTMRGRSYD